MESILTVTGTMEIDYLLDFRIEYLHSTKQIIITPVESEIQTGKEYEIDEYIRDRFNNGYELILSGVGLLKKFHRIRMIREYYKRVE